MKPSIQTLGQILYSPSHYVIPVFQRNYRWEAPQWAKLWDSLVEIQNPEKCGNHFMGFLVFVPGLPQPGQNTTFHLVDGQQRLTTCSILLAAARNVARRLGQTVLSDEIHQYYLVHPLKKAEHHYRLLPKKRDHDSYLALVSGKADPTGRMFDALAYFEDQLTDHAAEEPHRLRQAFETACQRLEFMCATLEAENAYNIFKSLNSTGVPLGPADLIRNFVFMHLPPDEHDEFDRDLWAPLEEHFSREDGTLDEGRFSRFFRDFLMAGGRYVPPKTTFESFEARYEATGFAPKALARELAMSVRNYAVIGGDISDASDEVTQALAGLNVLESSTTYPLLLALFEKRAAGVIDSGRLAQAVEMLRGFILRRFVCGDSSRGYGQMFVRALSKDVGDPVATLEAYLLERGWPDDHQFEAAFVEFPLYQRGYTREVLETLERARRHKEPADLEAVQVEHVMPQTLSEAWIRELGSDAERIHADWLHRPGNLTLSAYNQELWNHPFKTKRLRYGQSNVVLTRELADLNEYPTWRDVQIIERGRRLALEASRTWIGPREHVAQVDSDEDDLEGPGRRELRTLFWGGFSDFLVSEYPAVPGFEVRPRLMVRLPSGIRHVTFHVEFNLRHEFVGIDIDFWREESQIVWHRVRNSPEEYNTSVGVGWGFQRVGGGPRARMFVHHPVASLRDQSSWSDAYQWLGEKMSLVFEHVAPRLRDEMDNPQSP